MKVIMSWSGDRSQQVARALYDWLPMVLHPIRPWFSVYDIDAGAQWSSEIVKELEQARFAIICLTPENLDAPWLHFEAGALVKSLSSSYVVPYLFGFEPSYLQGPLLQFQAVRANEEDTWHLVQTMNRALGDRGIKNEQLKTLFSALWPVLSEKFDKIKRTGPEARKNGKKRTSFDSNEALDTLTSRISQLEETVRTLVLAPSRTSRQTGVEDIDKNVFLVHGRNEGVKETVARWLERLGAVAIVLQEQPNEGRTVIEKFESFSNVGYAVVLMAGDDIGGRVNDTELRARVRQNVIFELGYFVAKLGRSRVCVLHESDVEIPSDFSGVLYVRLDNEGVWRFSLARELKAAGIRVDLNKLVE
jgi:predicted nucleotide-binding protein